MERPIIFYDGTCSLCHGVVRFLIQQDRGGGLAFAPLQGKTIATLVSEADRAALPDSLVLRTPDGALAVRSDAVLGGLREIGGLWGAVAALAAWVPRPLRDIIYDAVAAVRYRVFGRQSESCPRLPPEWRGRILD